MSYAVYDGIELKAMNFDEKELSDSIYGTELTKSFSASLLGAEPTVKAFLWDEIGGLGFMTDSVKISK